MAHECLEAALRCDQACVIGVDTDPLALATLAHNWKQAFGNRARTLLQRDVMTLSFDELVPRLPDGSLAKRPAFVILNDPLWDVRHDYSLSSDAFTALLLKDFADPRVHVCVVRSHLRWNGGGLAWVGCSQAGGVGGSFWWHSNKNSVIKLLQQLTVSTRTGASVAQP